MKKGRLLKLAHFLEFLPDEAVQHFDMGQWFTVQPAKIAKLPAVEVLHVEDPSNGLEGHAIVEVQAKTLTAGCGTAACALGWACSVPEFQKKGLVAMRKTYQGAVWLMPYYKGQTNEEAGMKFFDLTEEEADYLFMSYMYEKPDREDGETVSPKRVARRIRALVNDPDIHRSDKAKLY